MIDRMYYDAFCDEYTLTRETIAPPERYTLTLRSQKDGFIYETWDVEQRTDGEKRRISFAFPADYDESEVNDFRSIMFHLHNVTPRILVRWSIPNERFDRYVKMFDLDKEADHE